MTLKCLYRRNNNCTLKGCLNGCKNAPKNPRIGLTRHHKPSPTSNAYKRIIHQTELITRELENQEYQKLKPICPTLQKTTDLNQAIAECLICNQTYCQTNQQQTIFTIPTLWIDARKNTEIHNKVIKEFIDKTNQQQQQTLAGETMEK